MSKVIVVLLRIIAAIALALLINQFVFSWFDLILSSIGLCQYKSINVPTYNGYDKPLTDIYNLRQIETVMRSEPNYRVNNHFNGDGLLISRKFNGTKYNITLVNRGGKSLYNLNTYSFDGGLDGAWCGTPDFIVRLNTIRMINDLPLNTSQKAELIQNIRISAVIHISW